MTKFAITRAAMNRIILPTIVGALMLGLTWTTIGIMTGAWPTFFDLTGWSNSAAGVCLVWLAVVSWGLGCGPAYMLRRVFGAPK